MKTTNPPPSQTDNTVSTEHTPGKWEVDTIDYRPLLGYYEIYNEERMIAKVFNEYAELGIKKHEAKANAELIASAPQLQAENEALKEANRALLEALQSLYKSACDIYFLDGSPDEDFVKAKNNADLTITKHSPK